MSGDLWRRLRLPWLSDADLEEELDDELAFHQEMRVRELIDSGATEAEARLRAERELADVAATRSRYVKRRRHAVRKKRVRFGIEGMVQDIRFGARTLRRYPSFSLAAVLVLGLGIGAPTTVLTLVNRIFFERPPGVAEPHGLVRVWRSFGPATNGVGSFANPDYEYYRENATALEGLAAWSGPIVASLTTPDDRNDQLGVAFASDNFFEVLGVVPALGRFFLPEENTTPGTHPVIVLSHAFWRSDLGGAQDVVGSRVALNEIGFTVVGVAPPGFRGATTVGDTPDAWAPIAMRGAVTRRPDMSWWERVPGQVSTWLSVVGRLRPGVTVEAAQANLSALFEALDDPDRDEQESLLVSREYLYTPGQASSLANLSVMLLAVVGIVLATAVANVAVLLLSRATARGREMGIRTALGAGRGRIIRQLLAESLVLTLAGGLLGTLLAFVLADAAAALLPYSFAGGFRPDARVLGAAVVLSLLTAILAGLAPALHASRAEGVGAAHGARAVGGSRLREALVVGQIALSLVLVAGAALFARSFWAAHTQDIGFRTENLLVLGVDLRGRGYTEAEGLAFIPRALERLRGLPDVMGATTSVEIPFGGEWSWHYEAPPPAVPNLPDGRVNVGLNAVSPDYFDVMGIAIVRGRPLGPEDVTGAAPAIVVNETLAQHLWPGQNPLRQVVPVREGTDFQVVGVARDATYYELGEQGATQLYGSVLQVYQPGVHFIVRTSGPPADLAPDAQAALREIDPALAFEDVTTMEAVFEEVTARYRVSAVLVGLFSALALALAATGLYGAVSFLVAQRTREIGVRMALGADRSRVARQVAGTGLRLAALGTVVGLVLTVLLRSSTGSLLYGVEPGDPLPLVVACVTLFGVAALATAGPARKATRVDPMEAIRAE